MRASKAAHRAAVEQVWAHVTGGERTLVVDSPPGAGKSTLVRELTCRLVEAGAEIPIVVQTNDQADDLVAGLTRDMRDLPATVMIGRLHAAGWEPPPDLATGRVRMSARLDDLSACRVIVATAAKWSFTSGRTFPLAIVDEAYQMSAASLVRVGDLFDRVMLVGDPGQLSPFTVADEHVVRAQSAWPLATAAGIILRHHPSTPVVPLPVSWRLASHAAPVVADAFYVRPFTAGVPEGVRRLNVPTGLDPALDAASARGWGLVELPATPPWLSSSSRSPGTYRPGADHELVARLVSLAGHLRNGTSTVDELGERALLPSDIAIGVAHRDQRDHVRAALDRAGLTEVTVDTANRLQGRQFEITLVWHPLSGRRDPSAFHLETGRLCVLTSRHRQACIIVTRAGIADQLHAYPSAEPVWLGDDPPPIDGWAANLTFLDHLARLTGE